jgi:hypothetical protein
MDSVVMPASGLRPSVVVAASTRPDSWLPVLWRYPLAGSHGGVGCQWQFHLYRGARVVLSGRRDGLRVAVSDAVAFEAFLSGKLIGLPALNRTVSHPTVKRIKG